MKCKCAQCKYEWESRKTKPPVECPNCKSRRWFQSKSKQLAKTKRADPFGVFGSPKKYTQLGGQI